jgi:hypothetical protein
MYGRLVIKKTIHIKPASPLVGDVTGATRAYVCVKNFFEPRPYGRDG